MQPVFEEELLSAYLDSELTPEQRRLVEERLALEPQLREALNALRQVRGLVAALPGWTGPDLVIPAERFSGEAAEPGTIAAAMQNQASSSMGAGSFSKQLEDNTSRGKHGRFPSGRWLSALAAGLAAVALFFPYWFGRRAESELARTSDSQPPAAIALDMPTGMGELAQATEAAAKRDLTQSAQVTPPVTLQAEVQNEPTNASEAIVIAPATGAFGGQSKGELSSRDEQNSLNLRGGMQGLPGSAAGQSAAASPVPTISGGAIALQESVTPRDKSPELLGADAFGGLAGASRKAAPSPAAGAGIERAAADPRAVANAGGSVAQAVPLSKKFSIMRSAAWSSDEAQQQLTQLASMLDPLTNAEIGRSSEAAGKPVQRSVLIGMVSVTEREGPTAWMDSLRAQLPTVPWALNEPVEAEGASGSNSLVCFVTLAEARQILAVAQRDQVPGTPRASSTSDSKSLPPAWWLLPESMKSLEAKRPLDEAQRVVLMITLNH